MKENFGEERVKMGLLSFQGKIGTIDPNFPGKLTVLLSSFDPAFPPVSLKKSLKHQTLHNPALIIYTWGI